MPDTRPLLSVADLRPGDHLCCLFETEEEHRAVLTPFLRAGLENHEKVLYIVDERTAETVLGYLQDSGLDLDPYLESGQLRIFSRGDTYLLEGRFDPHRMIGMLGEETRKALEEGYGALRVTGEMSWALRGLPGSERLIEYENSLNEFFHNNRILGICQYDRRLFAPDVLLDVLKTHPYALIGTEIYRNFYYVPPDELLENQAAALLKRWIGNLVERKRSRESLQQEKNLIAAILDTSGGLIVVLDPEGLIIIFNHTCERITGYTLEEVRGRHVWDLFILPEEAEGVKQTFNALLAGQFPYDYENYWVSKAGQRRRIAWTNTVLRDERGELQYVIATGLDVTEREQVDLALRRELSSLEDMSGSPKVGVTANTFGLLSLSRADPEIFEDLAVRLKQVLEMALEERMYRVERRISSHLRSVAQRLGVLRVGPRDVIDLYLTALNRLTAGLSRQKVAAYTDEGRLILVELMGYLTTFYRDRMQEPASVATSGAFSIRSPGGAHE